MPIEFSVKKGKRYIRQNESLPFSRVKMVNRVTNIGLALLWVGAIVLISYMIFKWQGESADPGRQKTAKDYFVDDMLLTTQDLELEDTSSLINITLSSGTYSRNPEANVGSAADAAQQTQSRKVIYDKILNKKIQKANKKYSDGFDIRPLPE